MGRQPQKKKGRLVRSGSSNVFALNANANPNEHGLPKQFTGVSIPGGHNRNACKNKEQHKTKKSTERLIDEKIAAKEFGGVVAVVGGWGWEGDGGVGGGGNRGGGARRRACHIRRAPITLYLFFRRALR